MGWVYPCECINGDCDCGVGLGSLGDVPPGGTPSGGGGTIDGIEAQVSTEIKSRINEAISNFGRGHQEADIIVPVQNSMISRLAQIVAAYPSAGLASLQAMFNELKSMKSTFMNFVNDPRFTDGRASHQALYGNGQPSDPGMLFYFDDNLGKIAARISALGGAGAVPSSTLPFPYTAPVSQAGVGGSLNTTTLVMLGIGALLLTKGKIL